MSNRFLSVKLENEGVMMNIVSGYACMGMLVNGTEVMATFLLSRIGTYFAIRMAMNTYFQKREEHWVK